MLPLQTGEHHVSDKCCRACLAPATRETYVGLGIIPNIHPQSRSAVGAAQIQLIHHELFETGPQGQRMSPAKQDLFSMKALLRV